MATSKVGITRCSRAIRHFRFTPRRSRTRFPSFRASSTLAFQRSIKRRGRGGGEEFHPIFLHSVDPLASNDFVFPRNVSPDVPIPTLRSYIVECVYQVCIRSSPAVSAISLGTADANPFCQKSGRQIETVDIFALEFRSASVYFPFLKLKEKKSRSIWNRLGNNQGSGKFSKLSNE